MDSTISQCRIKQCSKCKGDTEFFCQSCLYHLCLQCKDNHVYDLKTIDHDVVVYHEKYNCFANQEFCVRHPTRVYEMYCEPCELPVCYHCRKHRNHKKLDVRSAYEIKRQQHRTIIYTINNEALLNRGKLLADIKDDVNKCHTTFSMYQLDMVRRAKMLKSFLFKGVRYVDFKHRCVRQKIETSRHVAGIQRFENIYEDSAFCPVLFLLSSKTTSVSNMYLTHHTSRLSTSKVFNKRVVVESMSEIHTVDKGKRCESNELMLTLMSEPELHHFFKISDVLYCCHISGVTSDQFWVNGNEKNLILTNTKGDKLNQLQDVCADDIAAGVHTVDFANNLIYIDKDYNLNKLSTNMKTPTIFFKSISSTWKPCCLYWSKRTASVLVGMHMEKHPWRGKITRYNHNGEVTQTIEYDSTNSELLYNKPRYITENNNGDIVVSDYFYALGAVVVTDRQGRHRFTYHDIDPGGICTDSLSHILVCDFDCSSVNVIDKNGKFLFYLLMRPSGIFRPLSLCYDDNTHRIWVGSCDTNNVCVYRYIERQNAFTGKSDEIS